MISVILLKVSPTMIMKKENYALAWSADYTEAASRGATTTHCQSSTANLTTKWCSQ